ncbi:MAG TPA: hypothetical protein VGE13_03875 [Candidatus Saccharimonadales bacterium]
MYEHDRPSEYDETPKSPQYEELRLRSEVLLSAMELVAQIATQDQPPHQSSQEYLLSNSLYPDLLRIPEVFKNIQEDLMDVSVTYEHLEGSGRTSLVLRLSFDNGWIAQLSRPEYCEKDRPFEGEIMQLTSQFGPRAMMSDPPRYKISVPSAEVTTFIKSLLSQPFDPAGVEVKDPQDYDESRYIQDVLRESRGATTIQELSYRIPIDNEEYEVETQWIDERISWVEINQFIHKDISILNGNPIESWRKIVARMSLDDFHTGIQFYLETNDSREPKKLEPDSGMVQRVNDIIKAIQSTLSYVKELQVDNQSLDQDGFDTPDTSA